MTDSEKLLNEIFGAGTDILDSVDRAITSGNFSRLNDEINRTVNNVSRSVQEMNERYRQQGYYTARPNPSDARVTRAPGPDIAAMDEAYRRQDAARVRQARAERDLARQQALMQYRQTQQQQRELARQQAIARSQARRAPFRQGRVSSGRGIGRIVGGSIMTWIFGISAFSGLGMLADGDPLVGLITAAIFVPLTALGVTNLVRGIKERRLVERYNIYGNIIGNNTYFSIDQLARAAALDKKTVVKDLNAMIAKGFLPTAHIDATESTLMLTEEVYQQYLAASQNLRAQQQAAQRQQAEEESMSTAERTLRKVLTDGEAYIASIRRANEAIPDDVMSDKLDRLESIMQRIFSQVQQHPESAADLRRLMDYYLPTINKLLDSYIELDRQPELENGTYIRQTKQQIAEALDTINNAFESLLDNMFQNMAWDVSSDISVMKTMLAQDGLTSDALRSGQTQPYGAASAAGMAQGQTVPPQPTAQQTQTVPPQPELQNAAGTAGLVWEGTRQK